jgi:hypothetical protein
MVAAIGLWALSSGGRAAGGDAPGAGPATRAATPATTQSTDKWLTLTDAQRHFHLDYPPSWKVNTEVVEAVHYTIVFAALNSAGKEKFTVQMVHISPNEWELNADLIAQQVPVGTAYIDVSWQEGPGGVRQFGPGIEEMEAADLSGPLKESNEVREGQFGALNARSIRFSKWGRHWNVTVYLHAPVTAALRDDVDKVLASFRFDGLPAGDKMWAIGLARKSLPAEADPDMYTNMGGSPLYYCTAEVKGDEVIVTFTKHLENTPAKSWTYRVTAKGEVIAVKDNGG